MKKATAKNLESKIKNYIYSVIDSTLKETNPHREEIGKTALETSHQVLKIYNSGRSYNVIIGLFKDKMPVIDFEFLFKLSFKIRKKFKCINRVLYDITYNPNSEQNIYY